MSEKGYVARSDPEAEAGVTEGGAGVLDSPDRSAVEGRIVRAVGGFYDVALPSGELVRCRARGRLKQLGGLLVGDMVRVDRGAAVIEERLPRRTELLRPAIANVDLCLAVQALEEPPPLLELLDRILVLAKRAGLEPAVVFTKLDLVAPQQAEELASEYRHAGYPVFLVSARTGLGVSELVAFLQGRICTLAGPSGAGKSTLLNALNPAWQLATGEVSRKLGRGRHTTREVSLLALPQGGWVADTPGFSQLSLDPLEPEELPRYYPEMLRLSSACRFPGCLHRREPDCAVRAAVGAPDGISPGRYGRYLLLLAEVEEAAARRYD